MSLCRIHSDKITDSEESERKGSETSDLLFEQVFTVQKSNTRLFNIRVKSVGFNSLKPNV